MRNKVKALSRVTLLSTRERQHDDTPFFLRYMSFKRHQDALRYIHCPQTLVGIFVMFPPSHEQELIQFVTIFLTDGFMFQSLWILFPVVLFFGLKGVFSPLQQPWFTHSVIVFYSCNPGQETFIICILIILWKHLEGIIIHQTNHSFKASQKIIPSFLENICAFERLGRIFVFIALSMLKIEKWFEISI